MKLKKKSRTKQNSKIKVEDENISDVEKSTTTDNKELNMNEINQLLNIHIEYVLNLKKFMTTTGCKIRLPNFPEAISENLTKEYIIIKEKRQCKKAQTGGDLEIIKDNKTYKIEVKCFTSDGPTSFGPTEKWSELYFVDAKDFLNKNFIIYKVNFPNHSQIFGNIKINAEKTYKDICKEGKRPRINFEELKKQLGSNIELIYKGKINFNQIGT